MQNRQYICVFCGSSENAVEKFGEEVDALGDAIVSQGYGLVYGGAKVGLMNRLMQRVKEKGGHVIGVITPQVQKWGVVPKNIELVIKPNDAEREAEMMRLAVGAIALPGGFGTLAELSRVAINNQHASYTNSVENPVKPLVILNLQNFYVHLQNQVKACHDKQFIADNHLNLITFVNTPDKAVMHIKTAKSPAAAPDRWWEKKFSKQTTPSVSPLAIKSLCLAGIATAFGVFAFKHVASNDSPTISKTMVKDFKM